MAALHSLYCLVSGTHTRVLDEVANKVDNEGKCCKGSDDTKYHKGMAYELDLAEHGLQGVGAYSY